MTAPVPEIPGPVRIARSGDVGWGEEHPDLSSGLAAALRLLPREEDGVRIWLPSAGALRAILIPLPGRRLMVLGGGTLAEEVRRLLTARGDWTLHTVGADRRPLLAELGDHLGPATRGILERTGFTSAAQVATAPDTFLLGLRGMGSGRLAEIRAVIPAADPVAPEPRGPVTGPLVMAAEEDEAGIEGTRVPDLSGALAWLADRLTRRPRELLFRIGVAEPGATLMRRRGLVFRIPRSDELMVVGATAEAEAVRSAIAADGVPGWRLRSPDPDPTPLHSALPAGAPYHGVLHWQGFTTAAEARALPDACLLRLRNMGPIRLAELRGALADPGESPESVFGGGLSTAALRLHGRLIRTLEEAELNPEEWRALSARLEAEVPEADPEVLRLLRRPGREAALQAYRITHREIDPGGC